MSDQLKSDKLAPILLIVVVVMAFVMGTMWNKLQGLESGGVKVGTNQPAAGNTAPIAEPVTQITDEQMEKLTNDGDAPSLGKSNAKVTIVEFSDLQCPFCKQFVDATFGQIEKDYIDTGKVRFLFRHYPLRAIHPVAYPAALASECAKEQNKFWEYHDEIFKNQATLTAESLKTYAKTLGLNSSKFDACLDSEKYKATVEADEALANSVGVSGTPAFFINGKLISGALPYDSFKAEIEAALK